MLASIGRAGRAIVRAYRRRRGIYRNYDAREEFLRLFPLHGVGVELGVFRGGFSKHILEITRPRELHLVDSWWLRYGEFYPDWGAFTEHGRLGTRRAHAEVLELVREQVSTADVVLHVADAAEYLSSVPPGYFDWAYLDTSHEHEESRRELAALATAVKADGMIAGHDWQEDPRHPHHGVCKAVRAFCRSHGWRIELLDNHSQWAIRRVA